MPQRSKFEFEGSLQAQLAGLLEVPDKKPLATVLFAHCFTCGKDIAAASRISRALVKRGFAVMRFDFTGLGGSDGDFANTNFTSNIEDLVMAVDHLRQLDMAPEILIGHSLGGTAVLAAAKHVPECRGVVTIGSPADARHVVDNFAQEVQTIEEQGEASIKLAGRQFTIRKQFLDDVKQSSTSTIGELQASLLVMHSPTDDIVPISEAERIYKAARHPKSFVTLDDADHLLSQATDSDYVANVVTAWSSRLLHTDSEPGRPTVASGEVSVIERDHKFALDVLSDTHAWIADEPVKVGGQNLGPDPYEHLLASVGTCTAMTVRMYAQRKQWPLEDVEVVLRHRREHLQDCEDCDQKSSQLDVIDRDITFRGDLSDSQRARLMEIADKCPVHRTLTGTLSIQTNQRSA